jgi:Ca2+-transporting ATPase
VDELPFDSDRKRMSTVHRWGSDRDALGDCDTPETQVGAGKLLRKTLVSLQCDSIVFTKGAVDGLLEVCAHVWDGNSQLPLDARARSSISQANASLAQRGMRVLGVAFRPLRDAEYLGDRPDRLPDNRLYRSGTAEKLEAEMTFVGMLGIIDPPRGEVAEAVARCRSAGIRAVMITGDHPLTAQHVAQQLKLSEDHRVVTGAELDGIGSSDLSQLVKTTSVYARVSPKHKLQLVQALQREGHVVAMTGDGVNDAPALKQAHIGVAMGITGTDVSKEASQMVLLDDNFATIVNAVEEGRVVYDNIRKFVKYTMTSNAGEIWVMVLGPLLGMPLPLLPLQILWVNLVTDGLPGLALAVEKAESNTMRRPPFPPGQHVFGGGMGWDIAWIGLLMGLVSIAYGYWEWASGMATESKWRTIVFTVLTLSQMGNALATRSRRDSFFRLGPWSNPALIGSVLLTFALQMLVIYWNPLQEIFRTTELSLAELATCLAISTLVFWAVEAQKYFLPEKSFDATVK